MKKDQGYFGAQAGDFNLYVRPIAKCEPQCQSFTNTVKGHIYESGHKLGSLQWEI